jgi:hypothetical protein
MGGVTIDRYRAMKQDELNGYLIQQADIENKIAKIQKEQVGTTGSVREEKEIKINELKSKQRELTKDIYTMEKEIWSLPSATFMDALNKQFLTTRKSMDSFNDSLAEVVVSGMKEFSNGMLTELLFGQKSGQFDTQIGNLQDQLLQLQIEKANINDSTKQTMLIEDKERMLMEQINQLEAQRSQILLNMLQNLMTKVYDKLQTGFVDYLVGGLFKSSTPDTGMPGINVNSQTPGLPQGSVTSRYTGPRTNGGNIQYAVVFNAPVYGQQDFKRAVDQATRQIASSRV